MLLILCHLGKTQAVEAFFFFFFSGNTCAVLKSPLYLHSQLTHSAAEELQNV